MLLYWDRVGTVAPTRDVEFGPYARALIDEGLLQQVAPDDVMWRAGATEYFTAFLELVERDPLRAAETPEEQREWTRVHVDKTGLGLALALADRGLARSPAGPEHDAWVTIERRTANLLMAFLASILCKDEGLGMEPITDARDAMAAFTALPEEKRTLGTELEPIRYALLRDILPGPATSIAPAQLAAFKATHGPLLRRFRIRVGRAVLECARIDDRPALRDGMVAQLRSELVEDLVEIERRMGERRWPIAARGALGVAVAALAVADTVLTGATAVALASGSLGLAGSVDAAFGGRRRREIFESPLAYAALARRELAG